MIVRTRFAPSPTGWIHVGGIRTALFAWLVARQANGQFILRIEDTDKSREVAGSEQHIIDSLRWLGIDWDGGPDVEEGSGPYRQSQRLEIYKTWAEKLVETGRAYADPYSIEEVNALRSAAKAAKKPFLYRDHRPGNPSAWDGTKPLRFKSEPKEYTWEDAVMGKLHSGPETVDDFILIKSDGYPTYNFAHIVDDYLMKITHVIRSQEFISSVPRYLNLYEALEFEPPILAMLPYVLGPDGNKKLSKRDGAKDILDYDKQGILPEAMLNFLATLGWNDGTTQEIYSLDELTKKFDLYRVQRSGAKFDEQRLLWLNGHYIRQMSGKDLLEKASSFWPQEAATYNDNYKQAVLKTVQDRLKFFAELPLLTTFFFKDLSIDLTLISSHKQLQKLDTQELHSLLEQALSVLESSSFTFDDLTKKLNHLLQVTVQPPAILFSLIRIATTWAPASPGLAETLSVLGKETSIRRLQKALQSI